MRCLASSLWTNASTFASTSSVPGSAFAAAAAEPTRELVTNGVTAVREQFDAAYGGFGDKLREFRGTKFPMPPYLLLLLQEAQARLDIIRAQHPGDVWPKPLDLAELATREPSAPRHVVAEWLPAGEVTLTVSPVRGPARARLLLSAIVSP